MCTCWHTPFVRGLELNLIDLDSPSDKQAYYTRNTRRCFGIYHTLRKYILEKMIFRGVSSELMDDIDDLSYLIFTHRISLRIHDSKVYPTTEVFADTPFHILDNEILEVVLTNGKESYTTHIRVIYVNPS